LNTRAKNLDSKFDFNKSDAYKSTYYE